MQRKKIFLITKTDAVFTYSKEGKKDGTMDV